MNAPEHLPKPTAGALVGVEEALALETRTDLPELMGRARELRDAGFGSLTTYSRKVFIPLTHLCRDVCHYCTFAQTPRRIEAAYLSLEQVLESVRQAQKLGCKEALFTLGERPELRYREAREALDVMGFSTTLEYVAHVAGAVLKDTGLLPHINAGCMDAEEIAMLRPVSASMGIMLESASPRLCTRGMPHYGSPDKSPLRRLETLRLAGEAKVPFTTGILIGIGETRRERIESLLAIRELHALHGHVQEIIIQNFRAKPGTKMANAAEPPLEEMLWTIAVARLIFGPQMSIQAPPNLNPNELSALINAGINDWGGVSPLTPDFVNPEAPWPHVDRLARETAAAGKQLQERLTIYPRFAMSGEQWLDTSLRTRVLRMIDATGLPRTDSWVTGSSAVLPDWATHARKIPTQEHALKSLLVRAGQGETLSEDDVVNLFSARGDEFHAVIEAADRLRHESCGNDVSYVVTRNINYTNVCTYKCKFCAFSKGRTSDHLRGTPYNLSHDEIARRVREAWDRGATEVCMQGGIHPDYTGETYLDILAAVKDAVPEMHVHAFSPLEVWQGARTLNLPLENYLTRLRDSGLGSLPGTAAEILDDEVRAVLCPDKINTAQWLEVIAAAHRVGLRTTATIMFGHVDTPRHWARHLLRIRSLQAQTGGFTEFVPLPFVAPEAPLYLKGLARTGPTLRESLLMHAIARLTLHPLIPNIQASWVKMGEAGLAACLKAGVNDLGGTLMNESITRAAGATHGQEMSPQRMEELIRHCDRNPWQRTTLYQPVNADRVIAASRAMALSEMVNTPIRFSKQGPARA